jgi:hypothetical protein
MAADLGSSRPRLRRDGTVVVHSDEAGYQAATRLSATASELIGTYVHVITVDAPRATDARRCDRRRSSDGLGATLEHLRWFSLMNRAFLDMTGLPDTT